jgi:hypothetical protein
VKHKRASASVTGNSILWVLNASAEFLNNLITGQHAKRTALGMCLLLLVAGAGANGLAQENSAPFGVSNPKNKKWPVDEAARIYFSACDRLAQTVRPANPPRLRPSFVLVLGAQNNEAVRDGKVAEVRLRSWDPGAFAQAVVILAGREILSRDDLVHITHEALTYARASVSVNDLRQEP